MPRTRCTQKARGPDLMEHIAEAIKEVLNELDSRRKSIIEARASNWPPFLRRSPERERHEVALARERELVQELEQELEQEHAKRERQHTGHGSRELAKRGGMVGEVVSEVAHLRYRPAYLPSTRTAFAKDILNDVNEKLHARGYKVKGRKKRVGWKAVEKRLRPLGFSYQNK
jgi:hypothetical protein